MSRKQGGRKMEIKRTYLDPYWSCLSTTAERKWKFLSSESQGREFLLPNTDAVGKCHARCQPELGGCPCSTHLLASAGTMATRPLAALLLPVHSCPGQGRAWSRRRGRRGAVLLLLWENKGQQCPLGKLPVLLPFLSDWRCGSLYTLRPYC